MKEIKAIVQPFLVSKIVNALQLIPELPGITVSQVRGFGRGRAADAKEKIVEGDVEYVQKAKLELVVREELVEKVLALIERNAHTGNPGDGKIFIYNVDDVVRIRTGERGEKAI